MNVIILVAGVGSRMSDYTKDAPKCMLDVKGKSILDRQLLALKQIDIGTIFIVVGYKGETIKQHCSHLYSDLNIVYVDNVDYKTTNNAYSMLLALNKSTEPFLLFNGDVVFHPDLLKAVVSSKYANCLSIVKKRAWVEEDMNVSFDESNKVRMMSKDNSRVESEFPHEFTGIAKFSENVEVLKSKLVEYEDSWFDTCLNDLVVNNEIELYVEDTSHFPTLEIDFPEDLKEARDIFPPWGTPDWEIGIRHGSIRNPEEAMELLVDMIKVLKKHDIEYWLNWGLLLGFYRDGDFIPWDTDMDVTIHKKDEPKVTEKVLAEMRTLGCFVPEPDICCEGDFWFIRDKEKIELNTVHDEGHRYNYSPGRCDLACPKSYIDTLDTITIRGYTFNIPSNTDEYLRLSYGANWKTPIKGKKPKSL